MPAVVARLRVRVERAVAASLIAAVFLAWFLCLPGQASDFDPFATHATTSAASTNRALADATRPDHCYFGGLQSPVTLLAAVQHALCASPKIRQAWAQALSQAAQLGLADTAYLPTLGATGGLSPGGLNEVIGTVPPYDFNKSISTTGVSVDFNWVFYDFGLRDANADAADEALIAGVAGRDAVIQQVIVETAEAYYVVATAQAQLDAKSTDVNMALRSYEIAAGKYKLGAAGLTEKLQAQTSYTRTRLARVKAEGALTTAVGRLDILMGLAPSSTYRVAALSIPERRMAEALPPINEMIAYAERRHPAILAARASWQAAQDKIAAANAYDLPNVSLTANYEHSRQVGQFTEPLPATIDQWTVGVQLSIPLSGVVERSYQIQAAESDEIAKKALLDQTIEQTSLDIWTNYQALKVAKSEAQASEILVANAQRSFDVVQGRYHAGVGSILELLTAQSDLIDAEQERIAAMSDWLNARIKLMSSLGKLDFADLQ